MKEDFQSRADTSKPLIRKSSEMNQETAQYSNRTFLFSMLSLTNETTTKSWNKSKNVSDDLFHTNNFQNHSSFSFFLFNLKTIAETSEGYEKSITILTIIIGLLGFIGNIVTILKILCDKQFHTPTFIPIGCLALPDTLNIMIIFVRKFSNLVNYVQFQHDYKENIFEFLTYFFLTETFYSCSTGHILFLTLIRYLLIVHPLQSKMRLTVSIVMTCSVMIWIYSSLLTAFILIMITTIYKDPIDRSKMVITTLNFVSILRSLLAFCAIIIIHIKKVKALKMSSVTNNILRRMNVIICIILSVYVFSLIPLTD
ncbi:somatostatin receptor type 5-like [Saccostrea cucullata]|uniref:somatostatin receptor type 5-like n=1 Tax=Saccostrea cuccullata TaxID=36930 RepID=UPI002ECFFEFC